MLNTRERANHSRHVTAIFPGRALRFDWPKDATLADLAECLAFLGEEGGGAPLRIDVRIDE